MPGTLYENAGLVVRGGGVQTQARGGWSRRGLQVGDALSRGGGVIFCGDPPNLLTVSSRVAEAVGNCAEVENESGFNYDLLRPLDYELDKGRSHYSY